MRRWLVAAMLLVTVLGGLRLMAQASAPIAIEPKVIAGPDVGFLPQGFSGSTPIGKLVVRVNGKWVEVQLGGGKVLPLQ